MYVYFVLGVGGYKIHKSMEIILYASITFKDMCDSSGIFSNIVFSSSWYEEFQSCMISEIGLNFIL